MTKNTEGLIKLAGRELGELEPLSFEQYLELLRQKPAGQLRSAAAYLLDTFDYFGSSTIEAPTGKTRRFALFDAEFAGGFGKVAGQEQAQQAIYRLLNNFAREGRTTRLILLHGPNGSAKTSIIRAIAQAMEYYATTDEGRMYAFRWIFPAERVARGQIGFSEGGKATSIPSGRESYAHLPASEIEAVLECDCRDHPLLLLPRKLRLELVEEFKKEGKLAEDFTLPHYLDRGDLCAKCRRIFDSLLASYGGDFAQVLRHVQVLRLYPSLRYRRCLATVEPQMHVDAGEQQVTASRSLASLPPSIAHLALFEFHGPLVDANRGMLEFNDMLKRPVDTFKYLLSTCETGQVALARSTLFVDTVFIASTNELLLDAFKEYPDFVSFKGRLELVRVPYLRKVSEEIEIYRSQFPPARLGKHLAPHTFELAALWAVLTRLKKPGAEGLEGELKQVVERLTPIDLAWLYDRGQTPPKLSSQMSRELLAALPELYRQSGPQYEGRTGASAREIQMILMNAAQQPDRKCVSPLGLFTEMESLLQDKSLYSFLQQQPDGDYQNHPKLLRYVQEHYLDILEEEAAEAMGLVTEKDYLELFRRYVLHVSHHLKNERIPDPVTGKEQEPDSKLMQEVEQIIKPEEEPAEDFRKALIARIGAHALEQGKGKQGPPDYPKIFPVFFEKLRESFWQERRAVINKTYRQLLDHMAGQTPQGADPDKLDGIRKVLEERYGYCENCLGEAVAFLLKSRFA